MHTLGFQFITEESTDVTPSLLSLLSFRHIVGVQNNCIYYSCCMLNKFFLKSMRYWPTFYSVLLISWFCLNYFLLWISAISYDGYKNFFFQEYDCSFCLCGLAKINFERLIPYMSFSKYSCLYHRHWKRQVVKPKEIVTLDKYVSLDLKHFCS